MNNKLIITRISRNLQENPVAIKVGVFSNGGVELATFSLSTEIFQNNRDFRVGKELVGLDREIALASIHVILFGEALPVNKATS